MTSQVQNNLQLMRLPTAELLVKLIQAARFNYPDRVLQLLQQGADVNARIRPQAGIVGIGIEDNIDDDDDEDFTTALEHAVHYRNDRIVATLLDYGADMNCINAKSETALIAAISRGYDEIVELLLHKGADVNFVGGGQYGTALTAAVCRDHGEIIKLLLDRGVDVNITTSGGKYGTALIAAICMDDVELVELLLDKGADANVVGDDEYGTALVAAICKRNSDCVKLLLDKGADFNIIGGGKYGTALTAAICKRNREFVKLLLDRGADVDIVSTNSQYGTALIAAICERNGEFVRLLVDKGVNVNIIGGCDYGTALIAAICERTRNFLELLLDIGGDVNIVGGKHGTVLIAAICGGDEGIVKALLDKGADVNLIATGSKYGTALIAAICGGDEKMIKLLLDRGADVNILATGGKYGTALIAAICTDHGKIVELLLERGADVNIVGGEYGTALIATIACALWENCEKTIDLLLDRGADVNSVGGKYGTALIAAIWENTREFVGLLLDRGAEVNKVGGEYGTALIAAICRGDEDMHMLNLLLSEGADVNIVGGKHGTALMAAICNLKSHEHVGFVELLLNIGADVNIAGGEYGTALIATICKEEWETVQLLLKNEADVNAVVDSNEYGHPGTALIAAVRKQEEHLVLELLGRGAAVNGRGGSGNPYICETALGVAIWQSNQLQALTFASMLLEKGADVNMVVGAFGSLLGRAAYEGDVERILYLERIGANPLHVGGSYPTARGEYPTALDAARSGKAGPDVIALLSRIIDKALLSQAQLQSCIPMRIDHIVHDHEQSIYEQTSTVLLKMHSTTALPPFPVPYSWNSMTIRACAPPQLRPSTNPTETKVLNLDFEDACAGCPLTPEQADLPCKEMDATVLARSLLSLVGISTEAANHHQAWIQNDIRYFVSYGYDLGLAYAAARVAWKDFNNPTFNVAAHRGDWLRKAMDIEEARNNSIYLDETGQELINSPYEIMPRRIWDLKSNRVVEFTMLHSHVLIHDSKNTCPPKAHPTFSAITHSWTDTMSIVNTSINQYQWPVPVPDGVDLNMHLRTELLKYGNDYVWLDVLCLRQNGGLDVVQRDEWKLDVPTIGNIFRVADKIIRYFNGLGIAFSSEEWDNPRNWLRRAWTLQEIRTENRTINAGIARDGNSTRIIMNTRGKYSFGKITTLRRVLRPVLKLAAEIDSPGSCSVYELAREMAVRHATHPTDKVAGLLYLLRITQLPTYYKKMSSEDAWMRCIHLLPIGRKIEILFDCPYRGTQCLFPTWKQLMDWPEYDPEYDYARAIWTQAEQDGAEFEGQMTTYIEEPSIFLRGVRAISHVHLRETNEINEYEIEFETQIFGFYAPYRNQIPFSSPGAQLFTLATTQLGHSYNWVVCEVVQKEKAEVMEEGGSRIIELEILKKVGVLRTDSCSELLVGSAEGASFIKKINALFV